MSEATLNVSLEVVPTSALSAATRESIIALCNRAWENDPAHNFDTLFDLVTRSMHVLAMQEDRLVGHACWAIRWLQPEGLPPLRTAYVDAVATEPDRQGRGIGSLVMRRFAQEAADNQLNALSSERAVGFYERLGWQRWLGPTAVRTAHGLRATPDDNVLVLRTPGTPAIYLSWRLIADERGGNAW